MEKILITKILRGSIAEELEIEAGDFLISVNGTKADVFDYRYAIANDMVELLIEKPDGEQWELEIEKDEGDDIGIEFENGLMDKPKRCSNKCVFCFIDQLPKGMRDTLYFKDDDARLSFLQGNYVTLTNLSDEDLERLIFYHLSPINISVHTTDPGLRASMLNNPNAEKIMPQIRKLADANIDLNFQVVLCRGINDGEYLDRTIGDLAQFIPRAKSLSVVPVGITKYREDNCLPYIIPFDKEEAAKVVGQINWWQKKLLCQHGTNFVFGADEFYVTAKLNIPDYKSYEGFPQLENGVGMLALFEKEFRSALKRNCVKELRKTVTIVTGAAAYSAVSSLAGKLAGKVSGLTVNVVEIRNDFFGELITVSGLLTGNDIIKQLKGKVIGDELLIPVNAFKNGEQVFLDGVTAEDVRRELNVNVCAVKDCEFVSKILEDI